MLVHHDRESPRASPSAWCRAKLEAQFQDRDFPIQKHCPYILAHVHQGGSQLSPACVTLHRTNDY